MNRELLDPFAQDFPDSVDTSLDSLAVISKFNPAGLFAGQYLAVGRLDGCLTIIDYETKRTIQLLMGHVKPVSALDWSRNSRFLLSASRDWNIIVWDLAHLERRHTIRFDAPVTSAQFHPLNCKVIVLTLQSQQEAILVDLRSQGGRWELDPSQSLPTSLPSGGDGQSSSTNGFQKDHSPKLNSRRKRQAATVARFNPSGDLIYVGTSLGSLDIFDARSKMFIQTIQISPNNAIKSFEFDLAGTSLVLNTTDRIIRVYGLSYPSGSQLPQMVLEHKFQDMIARTPWQGCGFSGDYVVGGAGHKDSHQIFIWDRQAGGLVRILEGPKDPLEAFDWHPTRPIVASVSNVGLIHIWVVSSLTENWSAYAPGFDELDENVEYREKEDEFDYEDESDVERRRKDEQERAIEVFAHDKRPSGRLEVHRRRRLRWLGPLPEDDEFVIGEPDDDECDDFVVPVDYELERSCCKTDDQDGGGVDEVDGLDL